MNERKKEAKEAAQTAAVAAAQVSGPQTRAILRVVWIALAALIAVLVGWWILRALTGVLLLVVLSIFFAYLIAPLVEFVHRPFKMRGREHIMPRAVAIGVVYLALFGSLGIGLWFLLPKIGTQITAFAQKAPDYITSARARSQGLNRFYENYQIPDAVRKKITENVTSMIESAGKYTTESLWNNIIELLSILPFLILIPILAFFLLKDAESFRRSALSMLPRGRWRWRGDEFFQDVNSTLAAYIRAQLIACLLIGTICTLGFLIIGVPYALLLGLIAGILEFIPLVGPLVVAVLAGGITSFYSLKQAIVVLLFLGVLRIVHDYVVYPRIIGQGVHLHPLAVILAILSGAEIAGVAGIFLAIPVIAIATVSYRHWLEHKGSDGLVAEILKPVEPETALATATTGEAALPAPAPVAASVDTGAASQRHPHPTVSTTPEQMARARPDLTTGELKLRDIE
ncbi:MAG TPA: AI-2E family transporter [Pyrinomonadaceae bacterium]|jgi:predicted PurR-regulated permease PerM